jgi:hypothetical protein
MELWVLSDRQLNSIAEWQAAIDAEGYPLRISAETAFETQDGFLPSYLRGELTGFECYHDDAGEFMRGNPNADFGHEWKCLLGFRWLGSKELESKAAWMAGTAYARATGGVIYNDLDTERRTADQSREVVDSLEHPSAAFEEAMRELRRRSPRDPQ